MKKDLRVLCVRYGCFPSRESDRRRLAKATAGTAEIAEFFLLKKDLRVLSVLCGCFPECFLLK